MSIALAVLAFSAVLFAWFCLFKVIPDSLMAMFRFRLGKQRDELAVEIHNGAFSNREPAEQVVQDIDGFIELAPQISPLHIGLMRVSEVGIPEPEGEHIRLGELLPEERERLEARMRKIQQLLADHALLETPSGWLTLLIAVPVALVVVLFRRLSDRAYAGTLVGGLRRRFSEGASELACREHLV